MDKSTEISHENFELQQLAMAANGCHHRVLKHAYEMLAAANEAGIALQTVKERLGHGKFEPWLAENFEGSFTTARLYLRISTYWERIENQYGPKPRISIEEARKFISSVLQSSKLKQVPDQPGFICREQVLRELESVQLALDMKHRTSDGYVAFHHGRVFACNGDMTCVRPSQLKIEGAVCGKLLIAALSGMVGDYLEVSTSTDGELELKQGSSIARLYLDTDHRIPFTHFPSLSWLELPDNFVEAVTYVATVTQTSDSDEKLRSAYIDHEWITTCDNYRLARHRLTPPINASLLIRSRTLLNIASTHPTHMATTSSTVYFRNDDDLLISCDLPKEQEYPDFSPLLQHDGERLRVTSDLQRAATKVHEFILADPPENEVHRKLTISLRNGGATVTGLTSLGSFTETVPVEYDGPALAFALGKAHLLWVLGITQEVFVTKTHMRGHLDSRDLCVCLGVPLT